MTRKLIPSESPFETQFGYSRTVVRDDWCFVAGTTGPDPDTGTMPDDVVAQTRNAFGIIEAALGQAGLTLSDVVRANYYITDAAYRDQISPILGEKFGNIRPAATMVVVAGLIYSDMKVEIEITEYKG